MRINIKESLIKYKSNIIAYTILVVLLGCGFLYLYFYFSIDDSELKNLETKIENSKDINKYITDISYQQDTKADVQNYKGKEIYSYQFLASFNKDFSQLPDNKKQDIFMKIKDIIEEKYGTSMVECGHNKYCSIDEVSIFDLKSGDKTKANSYTYDFNSEKITHNYDDKDGNFQTETIGSTNSNDNSSGTDSSVFDDTSEQGTPTETNPGDLNSSDSTDTTEQTTQEPEIGMTTDEVLATSWGKPEDINRTTTANGTDEQWVYSGYRYLYFEDGILVTIQD